jgi:chromosomal replication initiator protein
VSTELEQIWSRVQGRLQDAVDDSTYRVWLEPLRPRALAHGTLTVDAPERSCAWVRERFGRLLQTCANAEPGPQTAIVIAPVAGEHPPAGLTGRRTPSARLRPGHMPGATVGSDPTREAPIPVIDSELAPNPRFSFDQFVIGDCNRLAHAAALTVAELPGQSYSPLFLCGAPGVGKTHLLRSIASLIHSCNPSLGVRACTGEGFTNEFQRALAGGGLESFKRRFRDIDVLLVDDVQFLERKTRTEEEFFHTFNTLQEAGAQLVLTSDRPPRDLQALEDRLRERFAAGLVADIQPPDINTRLAILRKRVHQDGLEHPPEEALKLIADRISLNVRTLEGALIRVVAFSSLTGRPITTELAGEVLDGLYPRTAQPTRTLQQIQDAACRHFGLSADEILSSSRAARVAWPRQVAMYLARELTGESLPAIGRHFGRRDHSTVLHAVRRTEARIVADRSSRKAVDDLRTSLQSTDS